MDKDYEKLFSHTDPPEPPDWLFGRIMDRIRAEKSLRTKKRLAVFSAGAAISLAFFLVTFGAVRADLSQSGLPQLLSLVFSDFDAVRTSWNDFALSVAEAIPFLSITAFLAAILVFLSMVKLLARDIAVIISPRQAAAN